MKEKNEINENKKNNNEKNDVKNENKEFNLLRAEILNDVINLRKEVIRNFFILFI
jgi:hypothetical protein